MPISLPAKPRASIAAWRSGQSMAHCQRPTISPTTLRRNGARRRWRARRPLHWLFPQAPSSRDYPRAQPDQAGTDHPTGGGFFLRRSTRRAGPDSSDEASASMQRQMQMRYPPVWPRKFHVEPHETNLPSIVGRKPWHLCKSAPLYH
jgi:hypothetical protein